MVQFPGWLRLRERDIPHVKAALYTFNEISASDDFQVARLGTGLKRRPFPKPLPGSIEATVPLSENAPLTEPTSGLAGHPESSPSSGTPVAQPLTGTGYVEFVL